MKSKLKNQEKGFTIIEVLIVLAIAGLIILIVFLAVPALQRNSRNTQYKNQVSGYLGAVNEFINNNNGKPPTVGSTADATTIADLAADGPMTEPGNVLTGATARTSPVAVGQMELVVGARCNTASATVIGQTAPGPARSIAVRYSVENSAGGAVPQCVGS
jgi:prepilin-type N-terminal cleavage/methylation domain-containing protein